MSNTAKVLYFAYGSSMFKHKLDKPSAVLKTVAKLEVSSEDA